jgi:hypothetical protein
MIIERNHGMQIDVEDGTATALGPATRFARLIHQALADADMRGLSEFHSLDWARTGKKRAGRDARLEDNAEMASLGGYAGV